MAVTCTILCCCYAKGSAITPSAGVSRVRLQREFGMFDIGKTKIGVIGLGSVGLQLAVEFGEQLPVVGYGVITAGTHKASSIRGAEAAKVIENTQRDVNIALINELALLFHRMRIDTHA